LIICFPVTIERAEAGFFNGLLVDAIKDLEVCAVVRGLRNGHDLEYEANNQYWNEDLGCSVPFVYFLCDRAYSHISSSAIREVDLLRAEKECGL
jgi:pantetheine-phosphate adenylyltransferase